jgi:hypothetical protein
MCFGTSTETTPREDTFQSIPIPFRWHILQEIDRKFIEDANRQCISVAFHEPKICSTP